MNDIIRAESLVKTYRQGDLDIEVLRGVDLAVGQGEFVALQGQSGSGKSTLLHILGLLERPTSGTYILGGRDVSRMTDDEMSAQRNTAIGFVFQNFYLIPYASALDNVLLPGLYGTSSTRELRDRAQELLEKVGLADRMQFRPPRLSGGQQQRVALARSLINDPSMILADEPTGQLDSTTSAEIMDLFHAVNDMGKTIVVVTHEEETARHASRRILVKDGLIVNGGGGDAAS